MTQHLLYNPPVTHQIRVNSCGFSFSPKRTAPSNLFGESISHNIRLYQSARSQPERTENHRGDLNFGATLLQIWHSSSTRAPCPTEQEDLRRTDTNWRWSPNYNVITALPEKGLRKLRWYHRGRIKLLPLDPGKGATQRWTFSHHHNTTTTRNANRTRRMACLNWTTAANRYAKVPACATLSSTDRPHVMHRRTEKVVLTRPATGLSWSVKRGTTTRGDGDRQADFCCVKVKKPTTHLSKFKGSFTLTK